MNFHDFQIYCSQFDHQTVKLVGTNNNNIITLYTVLYSYSTIVQYDPICCLSGL